MSAARGRKRATRDPRKSRIKPSMLRGYGPRMSQRRPVRGAQEPQSAEEPLPPFGLLIGFWRGTVQKPVPPRIESRQTFMTLSTGTRLGPYEILSPLGAGGIGEVYRAKDPRIDRTVALKALPEEFFEDTARRTRLAREARKL